MLVLERISAGYGDHPVLRDVDLEVPASTVVALLGPNGAGKTTLLRVASGTLPARSGRVTLAGEDVTGRSAGYRSRGGLCHVPEGRGVFGALTVRENVTVFAEPGKEREAFDAAATAFPVLGRRHNQVAGTLSGGEQQMLALARAWIREPRLVLVDEPTLGLAPIIIDEVYAFLDRLRAAGTSMLVVEQYVDRVLALADLVYVMVNGTIAHSAPVSEVDRDDLAKHYMSA